MEFEVSLPCLQESDMRHNPEPDESSLHHMLFQVFGQVWGPGFLCDGRLGEAISSTCIPRVSHAVLTRAPFNTNSFVLWRGHTPFTTGSRMSRRHLVTQTIKLSSASYQILFPTYFRHLYACGKFKHSYTGLSFCTVAYTRYNIHGSYSRQTGFSAEF
jgi:hypothetical protein